jgi:hypothetical protein
MRSTLRTSLAAAALMLGALAPAFAAETTSPGASPAPAANPAVTAPAGNAPGNSVGNPVGSHGSAATSQRQARPAERHTGGNVSTPAQQAAPAASAPARTN